MKKLVLIAILTTTLLATFTSCKKEEESNDTISYQIINNSSFYQSTIPYLDGSIYEVVVFQYNGNDVIKQDNLSTLTYSGGKSKIITAETNCEKIKVSYKLLPPESAYYNLSSNNRKYIVSYFYLTKGKTITVTLDDNTMVSNTRAETKSNDNSLSIFDCLVNLYQ